MLEMIIFKGCDFQVRRTRISERMRKLQELVPNMDKVEFSMNFFFSGWIIFINVSSIQSLISVFEIFFLFFWQQTNTADMLDLAVEYIKDLQKQYSVNMRNYSQT